MPGCDRRPRVIDLVNGSLVSKKQAARDRQARVEEMRLAQRRRERRTSLLVVASSLLVVSVLVGLVVVVVVREQQRTAAVQAAADAPIDGIQETSDLTQSHVDTPVQYEQTPPVGGDHAPVWTNCGFYPEPVSSEQSVHSLEHGAVWITYRPDLPADQIEALRTLAQGQTYLLVSPFDGLPSPVVASAWGVQLAVEEAADPRLEAFTTKYLQGEQTPEPGASCFGGVGTPA